MEPTPFRDNGPYESAEQALAQLAATTHGIPATQAAPGFVGEMVLMESLLMTGVKVSGWEDTIRADIVRTLSPDAVQVVAGWLIRAHLAGRVSHQQG